MAPVALTDELELLSELGAGDDVDEEVDGVVELGDELEDLTDVVNLLEHPVSCRLVVQNVYVDYDGDYDQG